MIPDDPDSLPPARRRRARRLLTPLDADERASFIDRLARRASPSFDFFLFSFLAGIVMAFGLVLDSPAILLLGALLAPFLAPVVGVAFGTVMGSVRFFLRTLAGLVLGSALVVAAGALVGLAVQTWMPGDLQQAHQIAQLSWHDFLVLALGAFVTTAALVRSRYNPGVASVALAYELYLPLTVAGFGLTTGLPYLWPDGMVVFAVQLAWAALLGALTLAVLGFRPPTLFGYSLSGALALLGIILLIGIGGAGAVLGAEVALPTPTATQTITPSPTSTVTLTPVPPTATRTPTLTATVTQTPTPTLTASPVPLFALVDAGQEGGAFLRESPGFDSPTIQILNNGFLLEVLSDSPLEQEGYGWFRVRTPDGTEGWIADFVLVIATPAPNWTPES
jgi:uncharacterized membrane protein